MRRRAKIRPTRKLYPSIYSVMVYRVPPVSCSDQEGRRGGGREEERRKREWGGREGRGRNKRLKKRTIMRKTGIKLLELLTADGLLNIL